MGVIESQSWCVLLLSASKTRVRELEATLTDALWRAERAEQEMTAAQSMTEHTNEHVARLSKTVQVR